MNKEKLQKILENHKAWLAGGAFRFCHADCTFYKEITMRWKKDEIEYLIAHAGKMSNFI